MTNNTRMHALKLLTLAAALPGFLLRSYLYASAIDQKGLMVSGHWASYALLALTLLFFAGLLLLARNPQKELSYEDCFTPSLWRGIGPLAAAAAMVLWVLRGGFPTDNLDRIASLFGLLAGAGLLVVGVCRLMGAKPHFLCHCAVSVFFAVRTVGLYRSWSSDPQLMDYGFHLAAILCLMLTGYYLARFHVNTRSHRPLWLTAMASVYFSAVAIPESGDGLFLLACALWAFTCTPQMGPRPRRLRPAMKLSGED